MSAQQFSGAPAQYPDDESGFSFIANALNGTGGFADGGYVIQYPRETADKLFRRQQVAWYHNALKPACQRFVGYLSKKSPLRQTDNPALAEFADSCNWQDDSLDVFLGSFAIEAKARGTMLVLVDMPTAAEIASGERTIPNLVSIYPEQVKSYRLDKRGMLASVTFIDSIQDKNGKPTAVERTYTDTGWKFTGGEIAEGAHALAACPVIAFTETGLYPCVGEFATIAHLSRRLYNLRSELDELLRSQTFSILTLKIPATELNNPNFERMVATVGTHNVLATYEGGAGYIAPPSDPADVYLRAISEVEALIRQSALIVDIPSSGQRESGVALQLRFQALNASLVHFARRMEDFERKIWWLVKRWLGMPEAEISVSYGKDFSIADLATEMEVAQNMDALNAPPEYRRAKLKQIIHLDMGTLPPDDLSAILNAVDQTDQETPPEPGAGDLQPEAAA